VRLKFTYRITMSFKAEVFDILDEHVLNVYKKENLLDFVEGTKPPSIYEMSEEEQLKWAYKVLKANNAKPNHGDVIWIGGDTYRNQGIHFWDAKNEKIVPMATHRGDYGHVPKMFAVGNGEGEFSPDHWEGISYYNNLQPYWSSEKKKWFCPLEDDEYYEYYEDSD